MNVEKMTRMCVLGAAVLMWCASAEAATWYVSTDGSDGNAGTNWATAKATIQAAVDAASGGDTVSVGPGEYVLESEIAISKPVTVCGVLGAPQTIVNGNGSVRGFNITTSNAVVRGFTITNGDGGNEGGGIRMVASSLIESCRITGNTLSTPNVDLWGGGVYMWYGRLVNCLVDGNTAIPERPTMDVAHAGGVWVNRGSVEGCTVVRNTVPGGSLHIGGMRVWNATVRNTIVYYNPGRMGLDELGGTTTAEHCCSDPLTPGYMNTSDSPLFVSTNDYRLQTNSPCIDAGSTAFGVTHDLIGRPRIGRPDIGAYEVDGGGNPNSVTLGYALATSPPQIQILSVSNRFRSNLVDINYRVTDVDSPTVQVRGYATTKPASSHEVTYMDTLFPIVTLAEGTQTEYGDAVVPTSAVKHLVWDAGADIGQSVSGIRLELVVSDTAGLPISRNYVSVPADTNGPAFRIDECARATSNFQLQRALLWALLKGQATRSGMDLLAVGGAYDGERIADGGQLTIVGRSWLAENMPGTRLATAQEIQRAREATTAGKVTQWLSYYRPGRKVHEFGVDTTESDAWYLVKE